MRRPRLSYANVTATLALVLATSGVSYAAAAVTIPRNSVGSPQVRNDSLTGVDIKEGSLKTVPDAATLSGLTPTQLRYTSKIPSGVVLKGPWGYDSQSTGPGDYRAFFAYGAEFAVAPTPEYAGTGTTTHCTGSAEDPKAQRGFVCVYLFPSASAGASSIGVVDATFVNTRFGSGVNLVVSSATVGIDLFANGTWAARAP
jgi:hypothetical protein